MDLFGRSEFCEIGIKRDILRPYLIERPKSSLTLVRHLLVVDYHTRY